jgi:hypothetical protein
VKNFIKDFPWYVVVLSAYPVMALFSANYTQVTLNMLWRPLILAILAGFLLVLAARAIFKDWQRAAFAVICFILLFSSYGHFDIYLTKQKISVPWWLLTIAWLYLLALAFYVARRMNASDSKLNPLFFIAAIVLVAVPTKHFLDFANSSNNVRQGQSPNSVQAAPAPADPNLPDIYYIILDSYGRADTLKTAYDYDNSEFIDALEGMGFYVASCSQSNYARTDFSMASSLNMDYIPNLDPRFTPDYRLPYPIWKLLQQSKVRQILEEKGYKTVAFATGFAWSQLEDADIYLEPPDSLTRMTEFEALLLQTTLARSLQEAGLINLYRAAGDQFRQRTLYAVDQLSQLGKMPGPKFVFAHIISPHPPFVFGPNGEELDPAEFLSPTGSYLAKDYARGYPQAVSFINSQILRILPQIIADSAVPPIIIVQGDHGPWPLTYPERIQNLNAYYLPGHKDALFPSISPVNTFRIVFNNYFGEEYPILENQSFSAPTVDIFKFSPVPYRCPK